MAEGWLRHLAAERFEGESAESTGAVSSIRWRSRRWRNWASTQRRCRSSCWVSARTLGLRRPARGDRRRCPPFPRSAVRLSSPFPIRPERRLTCATPDAFGSVRDTIGSRIRTARRQRDVLATLRLGAWPDAADAAAPAPGLIPPPAPPDAAVTRCATVGIIAAPPQVRRSRRCVRPGGKRRQEEIDDRRDQPSGIRSSPGVARGPRCSGPLLAPCSSPLPRRGAPPRRPTSRPFATRGPRATPSRPHTADSTTSAMPPAAAWSGDRDRTRTREKTPGRQCIAARCWRWCCCWRSRPSSPSRAASGSPTRSSWSSAASCSASSLGFPRSRSTRT